ncbi:MAG: HAMP domain-containing sensor histidine kinase [Bacteroidales bacterium]
MTELTDELLLSEIKKRLTGYKEKQKELEMLTKELFEVNNRLKESEALKTHFISNITNEIVNPFASIIALSTEILQMKEQNFDKVKTLISLIHAETFYLDFQLRNIFAAAQIEAGEGTFEPVNVEIPRFFKNIIEAFTIECEKREINIIFNLPEDGTIFTTDAQKLKLVVINILSNAIKFSYERNNVELQVWIADNNLNFSIRDYGIGFSNKYKDVIFDRFRRLDNTINSITRGHGLGLSIVKDYLEILKGTIDVHSIKEQGTIVTVTIPQSSIQSEEITDGDELLFDDGFTF